MASPIFNCNAERVYPIGEKNTYLSISEFKGLKYVHIRRYKKKEEVGLVPMKKGIALSPDEFKEVTKLGDEVEKELKKIEEKNKKSSSSKSKKRKIVSSSSSSDSE